jgi:ribonuclease P protein subunit POP4
MITAKNILLHEIVGMQASIEECSDPRVINLEGRIIYETKNMITIRTDNGCKRSIAKAVARKIRISTPNGSCCFISGSSLRGRPQDRMSRL